MFCSIHTSVSYFLLQLLNLCVYGKIYMCVCDLSILVWWYLGRLHAYSYPKGIILYKLSYIICSHRKEYALWFYLLCFEPSHQSAGTVKLQCRGDTVLSLFAATNPLWSILAVLKFVSHIPSHTNLSANYSPNFSALLFVPYPDCLGCQGGKPSRPKCNFKKLNPTGSGWPCSLLSEWE